MLDSTIARVQLVGQALTAVGNHLNLVKTSNERKFTNNIRKFSLVYLKSSSDEI